MRCKDCKYLYNYPSFEKTGDIYRLPKFQFYKIYECRLLNLVIATDGTLERLNRCSLNCPLQDIPISQKIKPCKICGEDPKVETYEDNVVIISCNNYTGYDCMHYLHVVCDTLSKAIIRWNDLNGY